MRLIYKRFTVFFAFTLFLAVLIINTVVTRRQVTVQNNNQAWADHTQRILLELLTVESLLKDAERGQRGFLYTEEQRYLVPYNTALAQLDAHMNKLMELAGDNTQQARLDMLQRLVKQKRDELAQTIELVRNGNREQARTIMLSGLGEQAMGNIHAVLQDMRQAEGSVLAARLEEVRRSAGALVQTIYTATALAVAGLILLAFFILYEINHSELYAAQIREREQWFRVTLGSIGDAVIATDEHGTVTFMNKIAEDLTGIRLHAALEKPIQTVFPIFNEITGLPVETPVAKVVAEGRIVGLHRHTVLQRRDGQIIPIEDSAAPIYDNQHKLRGVVMIFRDVTAEKQAANAMRNAEKLAAASRLAASMAHEINNPLEAVNNLIYIVRNTGDLPDQAQDYLTMAERELERISHLTRQTLGFYRDPAGPITVDVPNLIRSVARLYENRLKDKNILLELELDNCPPVQALQGELKQLVANLIANAADAVGNNGKIRVSTASAASQQGPGVEIKVADNGPGIAEENREHLFEPFFTTKKDIGTGLGLWVCQQIAERHRGNITVANGDKDDLRGAVFTTFLLGIVEENVLKSA